MLTFNALGKKQDKSGTQFNYLLPDFSEDRFSPRDVPPRFHCRILFYLFPPEKVGQSSPESPAVADVTSEVHQGILWNTY